MSVPSPEPHQRILGEVLTKAYNGAPPKTLLQSAIHGVIGAYMIRANPELHLKLGVCRTHYSTLKLNYFFYIFFSLFFL